MDKETLSHYGWIIICVLVLATLLAFASPFSNFIARGFEATSAGFAFTADNAVTGTMDGVAPPSLKELQERHKFEYYSSLALALDDINAETIGENADVDKEHAVAGVYVDKGQTYAVLLKDSNETRTVKVYKDVTINLGGNTLTSSQICIMFYEGTSVIDGRLKGSKVQALNITNKNQMVIAVNTNASLTINEGTYYKTSTAGGPSTVLYTKGTLTANNITATLKESGAKGTGNCIVNVVTNGNFALNNSTITGTSENNETIGVFLGNGQGSVKVASSTLSLSNKSDQFTYGIYTSPSSEATITNSEISITGCDVNGIDARSNKTIVKDTKINLISNNSTRTSGIECSSNNATLSNCNITFQTNPRNNESAVHVVPIGLWNAEANIEKANVSGTINDGENVKNSVAGIYFDNSTGSINNSTVTIKNLEDELSTTRGVYCYNNSNLTVSNSTIKVYSHYTYDEVTKEYKCSSYGIMTMKNTKTNINNCNIFGMHSAVHPYGDVTIDGGTYEGVGHGGAYFSGADTTHIVKNATLKEAPVPKGYTATSGSNYAGFYIGGAGGINIKVYMDNCKIAGSKNCFAIRKWEGEQYNTLYISNSTATITPKYRIDNTTHKVYLGTGNNFTANDATLPQQVVVTNEVYK